ncbi:multidrug ABC transporter ATP-binding protein [Methanocella sp. CWC-04]|uniref:Multidrug ABC transporter ATP-binding protein n=1 Tax=Methanooceanicella nereidis TaxID=2052831 RepID=A0AAP2W5I7_9EURY|nr:ABC transporter ATP-binding protein [Methanocella sp. CWC-04]MCD1293399.1 multidrug ABC transporter ATP-binding protein [Methanocella sp. CWC-04]
MIEASGLTRNFGNFTAVDHIDLNVKKGEVFGFLGPNGAGKTTTVRLLSCLIRPSSGDAQICGHDIMDPNEAKEIRNKVGILTENSGFYDCLSVRKNLLFYADLYRVDRRMAEKNIEYYLKLFGLWELRNSNIGGFSKGMRQKLALTRCLVHEPSVLFLDEPTSGLDPESARIVRESILTLKNEGKTVFLCTHNLDEAERLCDRIGIMNRRLLDVNSPEKLKNMAYGRKVVVRLERMLDPVYDAISGMNTVKGFEAHENNLVIEVEDPEIDNADIINRIVLAGGRIQFVSELRHSLEDVYIKLVGDSCEH